MTELKSTEFKEINNFEDIVEPHPLSDDLMKGIYAFGWERPSETQRRGIPAIVTGRDTIVQAQSGTGKTGTFSISLLYHIIPDQPTVQGIILLPTIELANQVFNVISSIGEFMKINFVECVGGKSSKVFLMYPDRATVLIGTPGRLSHMCEKMMPNDKPQEWNVKILVVDEFDKTLSVKFREQVSSIFRNCRGNDTQVVLSSATVDERMREFISHELNLIDPIKIYLDDSDIPLKGIEQYYVDAVADDYKFDIIMDIYKAVIIAQCIIFVNSKEQCMRLVEKFKNESKACDFSIGFIHGELEHKDRETVMNDFRENRIRILITTDLMARGIDVQTVSLVINYDVPASFAQYIHRIGRTSRYGRKGFALNLIGSNREFDLLRGIEKYYSIQIKELPNDFATILK